MTKPKVLIGLPTMGSVHMMLTVMLTSWIAEQSREGLINLSIYPTYKVQPVDNARNEIVEEFLKSDCTHLFFIDSDTVPPADALYTLLAHKKPVVSGITPIIEMRDNRQPWRKWNVVDQNDKHVQPNTGIIKMKGCGSSCILIERSVFEKIEKPWYNFITVKSEKGNEKQVGEDIHFIVKCLNAGIECIADTSVICRHEKSFLW